MSQEMIARILAIEQRASRLREDAEREAQDLLREAEQAASALVEQTLAEARREADQMTTAGKASADSQRAEILAQAQAEADALDARAANHFDQAVRFVVGRVAGRE